MIDFSGGSLFIQRPNEEPVLLGNGMIGTMEYELSADEEAPAYINLNKNKECTFEFTYPDFSSVLPLNNLFDQYTPNNFTIEFNHPIMIQARWHKKPRVRKKWLKRYGMKPDFIRVCADATTIKYHPGHIVDEYKCSDGIMSTFDSFDFETSGLDYALRPDQKRRGIKIEW